jgi:hypothetical protein
MKMFLNNAIAFIFIIASWQVIGQDKIDRSDTGIMAAIDEVKAELNGTEIGSKLDLWHSSFKTNNLKLKMLFDEEGFVLMLKVISLGNRLIRDDASLESSDVKNLLSFMSVAERLGCKAPSGLIDKISKSLNSGTGKKWKECIEILKSNN